MNEPARDPITVRIALSYTGQPEWKEVMAVEASNHDDIATALHELADEWWEQATFEQITNQLRPHQ